MTERQVRIVGAMYIELLWFGKSCSSTSAALGLAIVAIGTYQLHTLTLDSSREHVMWLLVIQGAGLGMAMMPIFTGGIAVIPITQVNAASAFNNVVQRVSGALGLAVLTAILTTQQAQQMAGRAALMPANTPTPDFGPAAPPGTGLYATRRPPTATRITCCHPRPLPQTTAHQTIPPAATKPG